MIYENEEEFTTTLTVKIGLVVAVFLLTTSRVLQAIELYKEGLIMLNNRAIIGDSGIDTTVETALNIITAHAYQDKQHSGTKTWESCFIP